MLRHIARVLACLWMAALAPPVQAQGIPETQSEIALSFAPVVKQAAPAVVNIYATVVVPARANPFAGDPLFEMLFEGMGRGGPRRESALGSGVIVRPDGLVVSNYHVVGEATEIRVELSDRREFKARVLLADRDSDLAVLRLEGATGLPALPMRNSDDVEVGELVLAIGNPFGVGQTVSSGIVSGLGRSTLAIGEGRGYYIQTDAAINPGNSGGALVDINGRLIGINTAILTRSGGSNGIGFAIPSNLVQNFVDQAASGETRFRRPWAGVQGQGVDAAMAEAMGLPHPEGVLISDLHPESPFRAAGLAVGDVILALNDEPTDSPQEVIFRLASIGIGKEVRVRYLHGGSANETVLRLTAPPDSPDRQFRLLAEDSVLQGAGVARINPAVLAEFDLPDLLDQGVVVTSAEGFAAEAGLRPGDVILAINGRAVGTTDEVVALTVPDRRRWVIEVMREGRSVLLRFRI